MPLADRDEDALYRALARPIRLYAHRHLGDPQLAADVVQEVLLVVLQAVRAGGIERPDHFALAVCRNKVHERRREARRQERLRRAGAPLEIAYEPPLPPLDARRLPACLMKLGERDAAVVVMSFQEERSAQEIAAALSLTPENVRVIRHRALKQLQACVEGRS